MQGPKIGCGHVVFTSKTEMYSFPLMYEYDDGRG